MLYLPSYALQFPKELRRRVIVTAFRLNRLNYHTGHWYFLLLLILLEQFLDLKHCIVSRLFSRVQNAQRNLYKQQLKTIPARDNVCLLVDYAAHTLLKDICTRGRKR